MQHIAVEEVLDESPRRTARGEKGDGDPGVLCRKGDSQYENRVQGVEGGQRVKATSGESCLLPLVCRERDFRGSFQWQ